MYLDGYVTRWVHSDHGSGAAGPGRREPADDAGRAGRRPGHGRRAGRDAADRPPGGVAAPAGAARGRAGRGPPGRPAPGLPPPPAAAGRGRRLAGPVPGPVGTAPGRPAHRDSPGKTRTREQLMTGHRILGRLRAADGRGVVRIEDRYDTGVDDLWSALTDPDRVARWFGRVEGDLRPGGEFRLHVDAAGMDSIGRVETCEPPRRLRVTTRETDESWREGSGPPPFEKPWRPPRTPPGTQPPRA